MYVNVYKCLYGTPLAQRASYLGQMAQLIMIILSLMDALTLSRCILNGAHTNHC